MLAKNNQASKTNAVRILERENIEYTLHEYDISDGLLDGVSVAEKTGQSLKEVYKTLVAKSSNGELFVFLIPVSLELDLKKAAKAAGVKKIEMLPLKELTKETGYVRGGCSAIGMKRNYPTFIDQTASLLDKMIVSAGRPGVQMSITPTALASVTGAACVDLVKG